MIKKIGLTDVLILLGMTMLGAGLYLLWGIGTALAVDGSIFLLMGIAANVADARRVKD